jgi:hypothetical protein
MDVKKLTKIFIGVTIVVIAGYDVFAILDSGTEASISWTMITWSYEYPAFTFAMGFVCGHLFWRSKEPKPPAI